MNQTALDDIVETLRVDAPTLRPQAIAFDGALLWLGSIETDRLYAIAPNTWSVTEEMPVPGKPWGLTVAGDELRVLLGQTDEDHRTIFRAMPGHGVRNSGSIPCPDDTGSHLSYDGDRLYVSQWYNQRIIALDERGTPGTIVPVPHQVCGHTIVGGCFYCVTTDDETTGPYYLTRVDARGAAPESVDLAVIPFHARGLAFDGERFWTNDRQFLAREPHAAAARPHPADDRFVLVHVDGHASAGGAQRIAVTFTRIVTVSNLPFVNASSWSITTGGPRTRRRLRCLSERRDTGRTSGRAPASS